MPVPRSWALSVFSNQQVSSHTRLPAALADASCFPLSSFRETLILHRFLPQKANREESYSSAKAKEGRYFYFRRALVDSPKLLLSSSNSAVFTACLLCALRAHRPLGGEDAEIPKANLRKEADRPGHSCLQR